MATASDPPISLRLTQSDRSENEAPSARPDATTYQATSTPRSRRGAALAVLYVALAIQALSALFFVGDLWTEVLGLRSFALPWAVKEFIQVLASLGLIVGVIVSVVFVRRSQAEMGAMQRQIDVASGNFEFHLDKTFDDWALSQSEQAVAIYAMKGFSNGEIAALRGTTASTVKSQMNSIYRKAGLSNRQQLISFLVEDLLSGVAVEERAA